MEDRHCYERSIVADLIAFQPMDHPPWRNEDTVSTSTMLQEINENRKLWANLELDDLKRRKIKEKLMMKYCDINTDPVRDDSAEEMDRKQKESQNFRSVISLLEMAGSAYEENENESANQQDFQSLYSGLLDESLLREANKMLMKGVSKPNRTKAGDYSNKMKIMSYNGKNYQYHYPENMENSVMLLVDRYNSLITASLAERNEEVMVKSVFNTAAWLVVEFLHLHPFSDGNGRLCRILCNYVVATLNMPFPTPIYHIYEYDDHNSQHTARNLPCRDDYLRAFVTARMEAEPTHPSEMAAMIIESNWRGWREFMEEVSSA